MHGIDIQEIYAFLSWLDQAIDCKLQKKEKITQNQIKKIKVKI